MACTHGRKICQILKSLSDRKAAFLKKFGEYNWNEQLS